MTKKDCTEKEFPAKVEELDSVLAFLEEALEGSDASRKAVTSLVLALEEAFVNVANYAYEGIRDDGTVTISVCVEDDTAIVTLRDAGMAFDPLALEDPDITASVQDRKIGGLGIYMIRQSTDECSYRRVDGENILTMKKKIRS